MIRIVAATLAALLISLPANASVTKKTFDKWFAAEGTTDADEPICSAGTVLQDKAFVIKFTGDDVFIQLLKKSWILKNNVTMTVNYQVDNSPVVGLKGHGFAGEGDIPAGFEFVFSFDDQNPDTNESYLVTFSNLIKNGKRLKFMFPGASEADWNLDLTGSDDALSEFGKCIQRMAKSDDKAPPAAPTSPDTLENQPNTNQRNPSLIPAPDVTSRKPREIDS